MEILILILKALLGTDTDDKTPPLPRRKRAPAVPGGSLPRRPPVPDGREGRTGAGDLFREMFGEETFGEEEVWERDPGPVLDIPPSSPVPAVPIRRRQPEPAAPSAVAGGSASPETIASGRPEPTHRQPPAIPDGEKPPGQPSPIAFRLRGNPAQAREAFIYSEIFGRPLAERRRNGMDV